jgi:hypothetical protein
MAKAYFQDLRERGLDAVEKAGRAAEARRIGWGQRVVRHQMGGAYRLADSGADGQLQAPETGADGEFRGAA